MKKNTIVELQQMRESEDHVYCQDQYLTCLFKTANYCIIRNK